MTAGPFPAGAAAPDDLAARLRAEWPMAERGITADGTPWLLVPTDAVVPLLRRLVDHGYERFLDCTVVDDPARPDRFELQYLVYSLHARRWFRVKARTSGRAPSIMSVFAAADWFEREAFDLFGVRFDGHPDLRRILLPDDAVGHPLRRDHPLGGEPVDFTVTRELHGS